MLKRREGSYLTVGTVWRLLFAAAAGGIYYFVVKLFERTPQYADGYREVTRSISMILSGAMSYVPFTVAELLVFLILMLILLYLAFSIYRMIAAHEILPRLLRILASTLAIGAAVLLLFFALYGANYYCTPLADRMGLTVGRADTADLIDLTEQMRDKSNEYAAIVPRDLSGNCKFGNFAGMSALIPAGYNALEEEYSFLAGMYAPVKSISTWKTMARFGITGMYVPFTGECIVVPDLPDQSILFTMAHEAAHRLAVAPEDEANFVAFLACRANSDRRVAYSGYFMAYIYCINALYQADPNAARQVQAGVGDDLARDIAQHNEHARNYEGFLSDVGERINNSYLKSNGQSAGTASYGLMVDLLLAEYGK